jgi:4-amino-4-deoxy-L-arabinose transferase-like glycosyltransferase
MALPSRLPHDASPSRDDQQGLIGTRPPVIRRSVTPQGESKSGSDDASGGAAEEGTIGAEGQVGRRLHSLALFAVLLASATLNLVHLDREGWANQYYAAAVQSMMQSWHNFFFVSFDPGGFVTVDKPPLGFWIQVASAKVFGFSGLSILLPEALAGVASVGVLYWLVRRALGPAAGLLAALMLAITPVAVVTSRNNTIDALLVLAVLVAAWAAFRATEQGSVRWLVVAMAVVGLGFAIKMLQAYLVVPAVVLLYLVAAPPSFLTRIGHLAIASAVLVVVSLAWPVAVDLTPKDQRPYVGSTPDNSALSLAVGYNGIQRLVGMRFGGPFAGAPPFNPAPNTQPGNTPPGVPPPGVQDGGPADDGSQLDQPNQFGGPRSRGSTGVPPGAPPGPGAMPPRGGPGGPGGGGENGAPGPLRLVNQQLGGQASWLLPLAMLGLLATGASLWTQRRSLAGSRSAQFFLFWGIWLVAAGGFFSVAGFYHRYYLIMIGPPIAALAAAGVVGGWRWYRRNARLSWLLLPGFLVGTGLVQAYILSLFPEWSERLTPLVLAGCVLAGMALVALHVLRIRSFAPRPVGVASALAAGLGVTALLLAPAVWSGMGPIGGQGGGFLPSAGPATPGGPFGPGGIAGSGARFGPGGPPPGGQFGATPPVAPGPNGAFAFPPPGGNIPGLGGGPFGSPTDQAALITYLRAHRGSAEFLVATTNANAAAPIIIATGEPVMALGGFSGGDPILTQEQLAERVKSGQVRFFLLGSPGGPPGGGNRESAASWVTSRCVQVPGETFGGADGQLYDCGSPSGGA